MKHAVERHPLWTIGILLPVWMIIYLLLQPFSDALVALTALTPGERLTEALRFFAFEAPKVLLLLTIVVFAVGIVRTFFSPERTRSMLMRRSPLAGSVLASTLGIVTPFCSCSAVPLFIGFVEAGVPLGVTLLVPDCRADDQRGGCRPPLRTFRLDDGTPVCGHGTSYCHHRGVRDRTIQGGALRGTVGVRDALSRDRAPTQCDVRDRLQAGFEAVRTIVGKVWPYLLLGIAVGAWIHGYAPENLLAGIMGKSAWWSVPVAVLIGIPLYSNAAGIIPVMLALLEKGASLGTALAFMMSVIGLSLPETIILRKVLKVQLIALFVGVVAVGIVIVGYLFNLLY